MIRFLKNAGAAVEALHLPDLGMFGNGHGLIYERNSDETIQPVLRWLEDLTATPKQERSATQ